MSKPILDPASGSRMFYFDKSNPLVLFGDIRHESHELKDGGKIRQLHVHPDEMMDFRELKFDDESFSMVVFDPPHMKSLGATSWMARKYGKLSDTWEDDIKKGFVECFRVLSDGGVMIFKWNEYDIPTKKILELSPYNPILGHPSGKMQKTHWVVFMKNELMRK